MHKSQKHKKSKLPRRSHVAAAPASTSGSEPDRGLEDLISVTKLSVSDADYYAHQKYKLVPVKPKEPQKSAPSAESQDAEVPLHPPFMALVGNLPMETSARELLELFSQHSVYSVNLARRNKSKLMQRGAHVELATRQDLIDMLKKDQMMCRGRRLRISVLHDLSAATDDATSMDAESCDDGLWTAHGSADHPSASDADESSSESSASVNMRSSSLPSLPIRLKPSSTEELERRMERRLKKLAEFENAQTESSQGDGDDSPSRSPNMSWHDYWSEVQKSEE